MTNKTLRAQKSPTLDELDRNIILCLRADPRQTNKSLAAQLSVTEFTIAARIRAMEKGGVMKIMAQRDFHAAGYHVMAHVAVSVSGRPVESVARKIADIEGVAGMSIVMGDPSLLILAMAASLEELEESVIERISKVNGVRTIEVDVYTEIIKHVSEYAHL
ncbi:Lrp/AsnC family transcriptional regulator [Herminiimonas arsenitoxidans]|uniref:Lrp/AsnC family transcriptional regulator n=1 Tax=Herminiimonas arsenitoxidans TaxID=1809410 RepID=UPI000970280D|nr:Lrp/AsnC family transcriptional regulator [Herminiimonas arsenitoxidans]